MEKKQTSCHTGRLGLLFGPIAGVLIWVDRNMGSVQDDSTTTRSIFFDWAGCQRYFCKLAQEMRPVRARAEGRRIILSMARCDVRIGCTAACPITDFFQVLGSHITDNIMASDNSGLVSWVEYLTCLSFHSFC